MEINRAKDDRGRVLVNIVPEQQRHNVQRDRPQTYSELRISIHHERNAVPLSRLAQRRVVAEVRSERDESIRRPVVEEAAALVLRLALCPLTLNG